MNSDYLKHLLDSLETRMNVMRRQAGNTDLEPPNYKEMIEAWYVQIKTLILKEPPEYFVDELRVYQKDYFNVERIDYLLLEPENEVELVEIRTIY